MGIVEDILKAFDRIPGWARIQQLPSEVDELKKRLAAMEEKYSGKWPPDVCKFCGERGMRMNASFGVEKGLMRSNWRCELCGKYEDRAVKA